MKIALILTGFLRTYKYSFELLKKNLLDKYNIDLYLATWDKQENNTFIENNFENIYKNYNLKNLIIEDYKNYEKEKFIIKKINRHNDVFVINQRAKEHGEYWANRLKDQWFLVKRSFDSIKNLEDYDLIMRLRFDLFITNIVLNKFDGIVIPKDIGGWNFTDHMAYGDNKSMKKYCYLHDNIFLLYLLYNIDITHAVEMPKFYLENFENPVKILVDDEIKYFINK